MTKRKKLKNIKLDELSLVNAGANQFSRITIIKSADLLLDPSQFENKRQWLVVKAMLDDFKE